MERGRKKKRTNILEHLDLGTYALEMLVVLVFELREHGVAVLASVYETPRLQISLLFCILILPTPPYNPISFPPHSSSPFFPLSHPHPILLPPFPPPTKRKRKPHIPRIRRRTPKPPITLLPRPSSRTRSPDTTPTTATTRGAVASIRGRRTASRAAAVAGVGVEEGGAGVALVEGGGGEAAGGGHWVGRLIVGGKVGGRERWEI